MNGLNPAIASEILRARRRPVGKFGPAPVPPDPPAAVTRDALTVFVPTQLINPLNARGHWGANAKRAKRQREAVALAVWCALRHPKGPGVAWTVVNPRAPKRITFTAHVVRAFDSDGLQGALKACRDGLQDAGLVVTDGPNAGHVWEYAQVVAHPLGVEIGVTLL